MRVGLVHELGLAPVATVFDDVRTTEAVREDILTQGTRGTAALEAFLADVAVHDTPNRAAAVASLEDIAVADASVLSLADDDEEILLANDKGLIEVARSHGVECW